MASMPWTRQGWNMWARSLSVWLLLSTPFAGYLGTVAWHVVNVPFWDDYPVLLEAANSIVGAPATLSFLSRQDGAPLVVLFRPQGPHPLVVQRLIILLQAQFGSVDFRSFVWFANLGWVFTAVTLVIHLYRMRNIPLWWLAPIPYLMLSTSHWESMDFASQSFEYYWGGGLFAVLGIILAASGRGFVAGIFCALALMSFGGALALFPIIGAILLVTRQWRGATGFLLSVGVLVSPYLYYHGLPSSPQLDGADVTFGERLGRIHRDPLGVLRYMLIFMGNYFSTGEYSLVRFNTLFLYAGAMVSLAAIVMVWRARGEVRPVLVPAALFAYVLGLSAMAAIVRFNFPVTPRYSMYALLALAAVYGGHVVMATRGQPFVWANACVGTAVAGSVLYWAVTLYVTQPLFRENSQQRLTSLARYANQGDLDALRLLCFDPKLADSILRRSKELGVYDFSRVGFAAAAPANLPPAPAGVLPDDPAPVDLTKPIDLNKVNMGFASIGGVFEGVQVGADKVTAHGWARLGHVSGTVDLVLILNQNNELLAQAAPKGAREDLNKSSVGPVLAAPGFSIAVGIEKLMRTRTTSLAAFSYSVKHNTANRLERKWNLVFKDGKITGVSLMADK